MSISRRGLLAAGLAVAAVGAMGVASTMNASADDTPVVAESDPTQTPPALLPSGKVPRPVVMGEPGSSSAALAAAGASAAKDVIEPGSDPTAFAPKGESGQITTSTTDVAPPLPPTLKAPGPDEVGYAYAGGRQYAVTEGASGTLTIANPRLGSNDWHSLAEFAVSTRDDDGTPFQAVEVGWTVDPTTFGDADNPQPHLFVYHWVNGQESCYGCGFVPLLSSSVKVGSIPAAGARFFGLMHANGAWWIAYDTEYIGSFPDSLWGGRFTRSGLVQGFGEVAYPKVQGQPCSQMGNGHAPANPADANAAKISSWSYNNGPAVQISLINPLNIVPPAPYPNFPILDSLRSIRYGGTANC